LKGVIRNIPDCINLTGKTTIPQVFGLISGSQMVVGYPSGLTIMAATFGNKTLMIWNNYYHSNLVWNSCPKAVKDKTYFAENTKGLTIEGITSCALSVLNETPFPGRPILPGRTGRHKEKGKTVKDINMKRKRQSKQQILPEPVIVAEPVIVTVLQDTPSVEVITPIELVVTKPFLPTKSVIVACVFKKGRDFREAYVLRLKNMIARHLQIEHDFVCLTDSTILLESIVSIPLLHKWRGWWSKIELFRPDLFVDKTVLYFDLDVVIVNDITPLALYKHSFSMLRPFNPKRRYGNWASGIMAWKGDYSIVYNEFRRQAPGKVMNVEHGDQTFISRTIGVTPEFIQDIQPGVYSYKRDCSQRLPADTSIICFHGKPRPHEVKGMKKYWV